MYAYMTLLISVVNSTHEPRNGMMRAEKIGVTFGWTDSPKKTPGERCSWLTMTRSAPLMINVPRSVMYGRLPRYTTSSIVSEKSFPFSALEERRSFAFNGTAYVNPRSWHSRIEYFGFST